MVVYQSRGAIYKARGLDILNQEKLFHIEIISFFREPGSLWKLQLDAENTVEYTNKTKVDTLLLNLLVQNRYAPQIKSKRVELWIKWVGWSKVGRAGPYYNYKCKCHFWYTVNLSKTDTP